MFIADIVACVCPSHKGVKDESSSASYPSAGGLSASAAETCRLDLFFFLLFLDLVLKLELDLDVLNLGGHLYQDEQ